MSNINEKFPIIDESFARWDFSWAEEGLYDLPPMIDKIIEITGESKINYLGNELGAT